MEFDVTVLNVRWNPAAQGTVSDKQNRGPLGLLALQAICAAILAVEAVAEIFGREEFSSSIDHVWFEAIIVAALAVGVGLSAREIRRVIRRSQRMRDQLKVASGDFHHLLTEYFERWSLTPSERDVAMLAIKGLSIAEIAQVRETKDGTIKAQCNAIYRKAGVRSRTELLSLFIEELMGDSLETSSKTV